MRLIRSLLRPDRFSHPFGRHKVIETSNACLHRVSVKAADVAPGSNGQSRGRSLTASLPSDAPEVKKARRKVSKDERKSMVQIYVHKYRTMNGGKFPAVSEAQKNVGGSYYIVRSILQEMEYNTKLSSLNSKDTTSVEKGIVKMSEKSRDMQEAPLTRKRQEGMNHGKPFLDSLASSCEFRLKADICKDTKKSADSLLSTKASEESGLLTVDLDSLDSRTKTDLISHGDERSRVLSNKNINKEKSLAEAKEVLNMFIIVDKPASKLLVDDPNSKDLDSKRGPQSLHSFESEYSKDIGTQLHSVDDETKGCYQASNVKERTSDELKLKDKQQLIESKIPNRELHKVHFEETDSEWKPSLWQNLKSFADGIFGMWRRS